MKRRNLSNTNSKLVNVMAGCLALVATNAVAFVPSETNNSVILKPVSVRPSTYRPKNALFSNDGITREYDRQSNAVRYLSGSKIFGIQINSTDKAAFERAAMKAIDVNKETFGVDATDVRVNSKATLVSDEDASVSFHVFRDGIRIQDAGITFHFKNGSVVLVKNESYSEATTESQVTSGQTAKIAAEAVGAQGYISNGSKYRVKATDAGYSLVKVDEYLVSSNNQPYVVQVDTTNGSVFELRNKNMQLKGSAVGKIYPRYFGEKLVKTGLAYSEPENATGRANARGEFTTLDDMTAPLINGLKGQYVTVRNQGGKDLTAKGSNVDGKWLIQVDVKANEEKPWDNADVAQTMVYVNTTKIVNIAKRYIKPEWFSKPLRANVNLDEHCNAYWDGNSINFFSAGNFRNKTCANTGAIADVVFHEWGHGLDDNTGGIDDPAMSEGFGDALSMYMTDDAKIGIDFLPLENKPVRDISVLKVYPTDLEYEVHKDGLIVAGAWYDLYVALKAKLPKAQAKELMGKFLFKGIYQFSKMTEVYKATLVLDDDNANLNDGTPNLCIINKAFTAHGLAEADKRCQGKKKDLASR